MRLSAWAAIVEALAAWMSKNCKRPVRTVLTKRYESSSQAYGGFDRSDFPGQKLIDAIDRMLGNAL
jgi:thymidylate kinase